MCQSLGPVVLRRLCLLGVYFDAVCVRVCVILGQHGLALHFRAALSHVFETVTDAPGVIVMEDDLLVSPGVCSPPSSLPTSGREGVCVVTALPPTEAP